MVTGKFLNDREVSCVVTYFNFSKQFKCATVFWCIFKNKNYCSLLKTKNELPRILGLLLHNNVELSIRFESSVSVSSPVIQIFSLCKSEAASVMV